MNFRILADNLALVGALEYARLHGIEKGLSNEWSNPYWEPNTVGVAAADLTTIVELPANDEPHDTANQRMAKYIKKET